MSKSCWHLKPESSTKIPKLAWVAFVPLKGGEIKITHGLFVEISDDWIVEGCWDAPYSEGNFHTSENFFGSGIRRSEDSVFFCSSMAMVDRLVYAKQQDQIIVSNSLVLLLSVTGAKLDLKHDYYEECYGLLKGILKYPKEFRIIHPDIESFYQVFSSNLILNGDGLHQVARSQPRRIKNYEQYLSLISQTLTSIKENSISHSRQYPMTIYSTLSSGYDSTAVTCLAKDIGMNTCFTTTPGSTHKSKDLEDGKRIADELNLNSVLLNPEDASVSENEVFFLAPTYEGCEVIFDRMTRYIEDAGKPAIVMTGYHGDKIWDRSSKGKYLSDEIIRGDTSGINLSEIRLKAGFINLAVPFLFSRSAGDIIGIADMSEMQPWQTNNDYDRPMPRRIAETHNIPGQWFGQKKQAVLSYYSKPINKKLRKDFISFLKNEVGITSMTLFLYEASEMFDYLHGRVLIKLMPHKRLKEVPWSLRRFIFRKELNFRLLMFIWACSCLQERMDLGDSHLSDN
jgi:hypothetical protein